MAGTAMAVARRVPPRLALVVLLALALTGCERYYSVRARAACPGVTPERVGEVLRGDPSLETKRIDRGTRSLQIGRFPIATFWSVRRGVTASVHIYEDPGEVEVAVGSMRRPDATEFASWVGHRESLCRLLGREMPQLKEWRQEDLTRTSTADWAWKAGALLFFVLFIALAVWFIIRPRFRPPAAGVAKGP